MGQSEIVTGIVLTSMPIGDYDKRITILTKERGKITAFARGAKRPNSQLLAATAPFCFGEFEVYEGRSAYTLSKAVIRDYFRELATDIEATYLGFYFLEFAEYYCQENNDEKEMLKLLYQSLRALESPAYDKRLVRAVFELKALTINGEGPSVFQCIHCRKREQLTFFSTPRGGLFCRACKYRESGGEISEACAYTLQYVVSSTIGKLYSFTLSPEVLEEFCDLVKEYTAYYIHHTFKSLEILESLG